MSCVYVVHKDWSKSPDSKVDIDSTVCGTHAETFIFINNWFDGLI